MANEGEITFFNKGEIAFFNALTECRKKLKAMHRRAQAAESELATMRKQQQPIDTWSSRERIIEAQERDDMMTAIESAETRRKNNQYAKEE